MTINCKGNLIDLSIPKVMGILNTTPDWFDGGKYKNDKAILDQVEKMLLDGATFIDIGAYSTKPGAAFVSEEEEESNRLLPVIDLLLTTFPEIILSVDTFRSTVASKAILHGAALINDIAAGWLDENMLSTVAQLQVPYIMMHMKGNPQTMLSLAEYKDIVKEMFFYFSERIQQARSLGIHDLIIDPGFGFSKTLEHNYEVMEKLSYFSNLELPVLVGFSRKSMVYKLLETSSKEALNGTTVLNTIALQKGASILRVHDVKEAVECITIFEELKKY